MEPSERSEPTRDSVADGYSRLLQAYLTTSAMQPHEEEALLLWIQSNSQQALKPIRDELITEHLSVEIFVNKFFYLLKTEAAPFIDTKPENTSTSSSAPQVDLIRTDHPIKTTEYHFPTIIEANSALPPKSRGQSKARVKITPTAIAPAETPPVASPSVSSVWKKPPVINPATAVQRDRSNPSQQILRPETSAYSNKGKGEFGRAGVATASAEAKPPIQRPPSRTPSPTPTSVNENPPSLIARSLDTAQGSAEPTAARQASVNYHSSLDITITSTFVNHQALAKASRLASHVFASLRRLSLHPYLDLILRLMGVSYDAKPAHSNMIFQSGISCIIFAYRCISECSTILSWLSERHLELLSQNQILKLSFTQFADLLRQELSQRPLPAALPDNSDRAAPPSAVLTEWPPVDDLVKHSKSKHKEDTALLQGRSRVFDPFLTFVRTSLKSLVDDLPYLYSESEKIWLTLHPANYLWFANLFVEQLLTACSDQLKYSVLSSDPFSSLESQSRMAKLNSRVTATNLPTTNIPAYVLARLTENPLLNGFVKPELVFARFLVVANNQIFSQLLLELMEDRIRRGVREPSFNVTLLSKQVSHLRLLAKFSCFLRRSASASMIPRSMRQDHPTCTHLVSFLERCDRSRICFDIDSAIQYAAENNMLVVYVPWITEYLLLERLDRAFSTTATHLRSIGMLAHLLREIKRTKPNNLVPHFLQSLIELLVSDAPVDPSYVAPSPDVWLQMLGSSDNPAARVDESVVLTWPFLRLHSPFYQASADLLEQANITAQNLASSSKLALSTMLTPSRFIPTVLGHPDAGRGLEISSMERLFQNDPNFQPAFQWITNHWVKNWLKEQDFLGFALKSLRRPDTAVGRTADEVYDLIMDYTESHFSQALKLHIEAFYSSMFEENAKRAALNELTRDAVIVTLKKALESLRAILPERFPLLNLDRPAAQYDSVMAEITKHASSIKIDMMEALREMSHYLSAVASPRCSNRMTLAHAMPSLNPLLRKVQQSFQGICRNVLLLDHTSTLRDRFERLDQPEKDCLSDLLIIAIQLSSYVMIFSSSTISVESIDKSIASALNFFRPKPASDPTSVTTSTESVSLTNSTSVGNAAPSLVSPSTTSAGSRQKPTPLQNQTNNVIAMLGLILSQASKFVQLSAPVVNSFLFAEGFVSRESPLLGILAPHTLESAASESRLLALDFRSDENQQALAQLKPIWLKHFMALSFTLLRRDIIRVTHVEQCFTQLLSLCRVRPQFRDHIWPVLLEYVSSYHTRFGSNLEDAPSQYSLTDFTCMITMPFHWDTDGSLQSSLRKTFGLQFECGILSDDTWTPT